MLHYWVDWADPPYPQIKTVDDPSYTDEELMSLRKAKAEIIEHCRSERQHWLTIINQTKAVRETDFNG